MEVREVEKEENKIDEKGGKRDEPCRSEPRKRTIHGEYAGIRLQGVITVIELKTEQDSNSRKLRDG